MKQKMSISDHMLISIENSEAIWKAIDSIWQAEKIKKKQVMKKREQAIMGAPIDEDEDEEKDEEEEQEETQFVIDISGNQWLNQDFIAFGRWGSGACGVWWATNNQEMPSSA